MYYIVDEDTNIILYAPNLQDDPSYYVIDPTWTEEINKAGSLEFTFYPAHKLYNKYKKMTSYFAVKDENDNVVWRGRVLNDSKDFYNSKKVYCEGQLSFFNDSIIRPYNLADFTLERFFNRILLQHNSQVESKKQFSFGYCDLPYKGDFITDNYEYRSSLEEIQDLLDTYGGYIRFDGHKIYYSSMSGTVSDQPIQFGVNMLDFSEEVEATDIYTVLIPLGKLIEKDESGNLVESEVPLTIESVNGGKDYLESQNGINIFGRIVGTVTFDDVTNPKKLKSAGEKYLGKMMDLSATFTITAADLFDLGYNVSKIQCGNYHLIQSLPHGTDTYYQCTKIVHKLEDPMLSEYTFGGSLYGLTDKSVDDRKILNKLTSKLKTKKVKVII